MNQQLQPRSHRKRGERREQREGAANVGASALIGVIRIYQFFSRMTPRRCRFHPTCSQYAVDALAHHGFRRGGVLALKRIGRCHPWNPGGYDPVP